MISILTRFPKRKGSSMMKSILVALALVGTSAPAFAQTVHSAEGDWSSIPPLKFSKLNLIGADVPEALQRLVTSGECELDGVSRRGLDMNVPFLVRFAPSGKVEEVVVRKLGCTRAEAILGSAIIKLAEVGTLKSTGLNTSGWYRSALNFSYTD